MKGQTNFDYQLRQIEKRRWQLWILAFLLIILFAGMVVVLSYFGQSLPDAFSSLANYNIIRFSLLILSVAFCIYIAEREVIFRRLSRRLLEEQVKSSWLNQKVEQVSALLQAGKAVNQHLDTRKVLDIILKAAFDLLGASQGSIMLLNEKTNLLEIVNAYGLNPSIVAKARIKVGESISGWVVQKGKPLLLSGDVDAAKYKNFTKKTRVINSAIVVPLKVKDKSIGVLSLSVGGNSDHKFDKYDLNTAQVFAEQVSVAIANARLYEQTKKSQKKLATVNAELAGKNEALKKANTELKTANYELEKFNKLTVDRELQMIKLKEAIKKKQAS